MTIIHVLLTFHLQVYYGVLRFLTADLRTITTSHDFIRFNATTIQSHWRFRLLSSAEQLV